MTMLKEMGGGCCYATCPGSMTWRIDMLPSMGMMEVLVSAGTSMGAVEVKCKILIGCPLPNANI